MITKEKNNDPSNFIWPVSLAFHNSSMNNLLEYGLFSDGIYCRQNVFADKFITFKCDDIAGLPKGKDELHPIANSKIPFKLYEDTIKFFRYIIKEHGKVEAYVLYACQPDGKYFLYVPKQNVGGANVTYTLEDFHVEHPGCYIVADQHSHVEFGAFWSGVDDADDKRNRYSVVSGMHQKLYPEVKVRFSYGKKRIDLSLDDLFENNDNYDVSKNIVLENAITMIDKYVYASPKEKNDANRNNYNGYNNYYKNYNYSSRDFESKSLTENDVYGNYYDYDESDYIRIGNNLDKSIYSSDRTALSQETARSATVIKCDKCGKFTNMSKAKKIRGDYLCNDCISILQDEEQNIKESLGNIKQNKKNPESLGEALLCYIGKRKGDIKDFSGIKKLQDFLSQLREA